MDPREQIRRLTALHKKIVSFVGTSISNNEFYAKHSNTVDILQTLANSITPILNDPSVLTRQEEVILPCSVQKIVITNSEITDNKIHFRRFTAHLELQLNNCNQAQITKNVGIIYNDDTPTNVTIENINVNANKAIINIPIDFTQNPSTNGQQQNVTFKIDNKGSDTVRFEQHNRLQPLNNIANIQDAITYFGGFSSYQYTINATELTSVFPGLTIGNNGKDYFYLKNLIKEINKNKDIKVAREQSINLTDQSVDQLVALEATYTQLNRLLTPIVAGFKEDIGIFSQIGNNAPNMPEGAMTNNYNSAVNTATGFLKQTLNPSYQAVQTYRKSIREAFVQVFITKKLSDATTNLNALIVKQKEQIKTLRATVEGYHDNINDPQYTFSTWQRAIQIAQEKCDAIQNEWNTEWVKFLDIHEAFEDNKEHKKHLKSTAYTAWKLKHLSPFEKYVNAEGTIIDLLEVFDDINLFVTVFNNSGGDGVMEYSNDENIRSEGERTLMTINGVHPNISFETKRRRLFDRRDGVEVEDVVQGNVGDCYLMSALISLANGNADIIHDIVRYDRDRKLFIVTLYREGVPVEVEVDRKFLVYDLEGYEPGLVGAQLQDDLWVPVIEKAYAKLFGKTDDDKGGDYTEIEGGNANTALRALLGNKVSRPPKLFLDERGQFVEANPSVTIDNPIKLADISIANLTNVLTAASNNGYEMTLGSPDTFDGRGGNDRVLIAMGNNHYMSCKHAYTILRAGANVVVRNPHGNSTRSVTLYDDRISDLIDTLNTTFGVLANALQTGNNVGTRIKTNVDNAIQAIENNESLNGIADVSNVLRPLKSLLNRRIILNEEDNTQWIFRRNRESYIIATRTQLNEIQTLITTLDNSNIGRTGTVERERTIRAEQTLDYATLKRYFESISINIISND